MRRLLLLNIWIVGICSTFLFVQRASAEWTICNNTGYPVAVAVGYEENGDWISEGWWNIEGGSCAEPISGDLENRYYFYYAEQIGFKNVWIGDAAFCVSSNRFTIVSDRKCNSRGYDRKGFVQVDTGSSPSWTTTLVDTQD
jgi:uncharacterized membrane protein